MRIAPNPESPKGVWQEATFGVLEQDAEAWWAHEYTYGEGMPLMQAIFWQLDTGNMGEECFDQIVALEIDVQPGDEVYVTDWGIHFTEGYRGSHFTAEIHKYVKREYANSLVPIGEFSSSLEYQIPEVICFSDIPVERIRKVAQDSMLMYVTRMRELYDYGPVYGYSDINKAVPVYQCVL